MKPDDNKVHINQKAIEHFSKGNFKGRLRDFKGALIEFNEAINLCPSFAEAYYKRGDIKSLLGNHPEAVKDYNAAIEIILTKY